MLTSSNRRLLMGSIGAFSPALMFANGELGHCIIPRPGFFEAFEERTGAAATTPTANGGLIGTWHDLITNTYSVAAADAARPTLDTDLQRVVWGADDALSIALNLTTFDKLTMWSNFLPTAAASKVICEFSTNYNSFAGTFILSFDANRKLSTGLRGNVSAGAVISAAMSLGIRHTHVGMIDIGALAGTAEMLQRVDRADANITYAAATENETGNFSNTTLYIGSRAGSSSFLNDAMYGLIVRASTLPTPLRSIKGGELMMAA